MDVSAVRSRQLQGSLSASEKRMQRAKNTIKIGKNKRLESMQKRRGAASAASTAKSNAEAVQQAGSLPKELSLDNLSLYFQAVCSSDASLQFEGVHYIRRLLSKEQSPPTEAVLGTGVLPRLVTFLDSSNSRMVFESCWAITNIASTQYTHLVVESGAVPKLVGLLRSGDVDVREQSIWCLGNVAGDCAKFRDTILAVPHAVESILLNVQEPGSLSLLRNATWTLSNLCRGKPAPPVAVAQAIAPALTKLVAAKDVDKEVLQDALWGLSYVTDAGDAHIGTVVQSKGVGAIVGRLAHEDTTVVIPALRTAGNMVTGTDEQTQAVLDGGFVTQLARLVAHSRRNVRREACWAASNIAAGTAEQIGSLVSFPNLVPGLVKQLDVGEWHVRKEAVWAVCNITSSGVAHHIDVLVAAGVLGPLARVLNVDDARVVLVALEAVENILKQGKAYSEQGRAEDFAGMFEEEQGMDILEDLQHHANEDVHRRALELLETYAELETEGADENIQPEVATGGTFTFGSKAHSMPVTSSFAPQAAGPMSSAGTSLNQAAIVPAPMKVSAPVAAPAAAGFGIAAPPTGGFNFSSITFS